VPEPTGCDLEEIWDEEWDRHLLNAAVDTIKKQVKPEHYELFDLYVIQKWPMRKITQTLGVNAGQVYLAKHRVGPLLKKELARLEKEIRPLSKEADFSAAATFRLLTSAATKLGTECGRGASAEISAQLLPVFILRARRAPLTFPRLTEPSLLSSGSFKSSCKAR